MIGKVLNEIYLYLSSLPNPIQWVSVIFGVVLIPIISLLIKRKELTSNECHKLVNSSQLAVDSMRKALETSNSEIDKMKTKVDLCNEKIDQLSEKMSLVGESIAVIHDDIDLCQNCNDEACPVALSKNRIQSIHQLICED